MTTEPLPGLPQPAPAELTQMEIVTLNLQVSLDQFAQQLLVDRPGMNPADAAGALGEIFGKHLATMMSPGAVRVGLLVAFEQSHEEPMNFIRINQAKEALTKLAERRRNRDKITAGGIILPGQP